MRAILDPCWLVLGLTAVGCVAEQPEHALPNHGVASEAAGEGGGGGSSSEVVVGSAGSSSGSTAGSPATAPADSDAGSGDPVEAGEITKESGAGDVAPAAVDHGKEYVWIDQTFHFTQATDTNVANHGPTNWYDDNGVDFYDGKVEFRVTVTAKADATPVWHELCHWQNALGDAAHVCLHCLELYTKTGEYTCETTAPAQGGPVDYHKPFVAVQNRVKDGSAGRGTDLATLNKGLPIDYHYTVVIVPKGQTFSGWASYPIH
jgi:hypothetical protein